MRKINNRGFTLVEVVISFAIVMILVIGMLNIILKTRSEANDRNFTKSMIEYKEIMTETISSDLIRYGFKNIDNCSVCSNQDKCKCIKITFEDNTSKDLNVNLSSKSITYGGINYEIPNKKFIEFWDPLVLIGKDNPVNLSFDGTYLKVIIPYYEIDKDINYGINIIFPTNL